MDSCRPECVTIVNNGYVKYKRRNSWPDGGQPSSLAVSKELFCFKGSESSASSKRQKLNPSVPPGVAFPALSTEEMYNFTMQAITDQCAAMTSGSKSNNHKLAACFKASEGQEGPEEAEVWGAEGVSRAEFTPGAGGTRQAEFTLLVSRAEFTPGAEVMGLEPEGLEPEGLVEG
eukprot:1099217-Rhodomonas_salina.3